MPFRKKSTDSAQYDGLLSSIKPKANSIYLSVAIFDHKHQVLSSPNQQLPTLPVFTRDRLAYRALTLNSANFRSIVQWSQILNTTASALEFIEQLPQQQRSFLSRVANAHGKLLHLIGGDFQHGSLYRHIVEYNRPNFKLLVFMYPAEQISFLPPMSRTTHLRWCSSTSLDSMKSIPSSPLFSKLGRQPHSIHHAQTSKLAPGLYLALFYCQSPPPNNQQGLQIFLEKHHEHRLPCVPLRADTRINNMEWEWLQTISRQCPRQGLGGIAGDTITMDDNDQEGDANEEPLSFLTKEMQQYRQQRQSEIQQQLAPFQNALEEGCAQLQTVAGVSIQLKDLFTEDSLCLMHDSGDNSYDTSINDMDHNNQQQQMMDSYDNTYIGDGGDDDDSTMKTTLNDLDMNSSDSDVDDDSLFSQKPPLLKKKTLSIADMLFYGQQQTQRAWNRSAHIRMLVIVKPLCTTPDFPVRSNFDFYPYHLFQTLSQDNLQFATTPLLEPPSSLNHHRLSMQDLLNGVDHSNNSTKQSQSSILQHTKTFENDDSDDSNDDYDRSPPVASSDINQPSNEIVCTTTISHLTALSATPSSFTETPPTEPHTAMIRPRMALLHQEKDMKGWPGRLLEFDSQRQRQRQEPQHVHWLSSSSGIPVNEGKNLTTMPMITTIAN
ncbi:hypothetical protein BCR42DRAFT_447122 [Absidia repens]|uniref:Uncharacterized protein n=1 Tax=Absidia repens TaxID=90262 RepID=A0A1X2IY81_9FUNG|nr:hypothetical protein BCR42DRAFT_447122 [Absidia repens]